MGDGRTKPIAEVQVGDEIYGTERRGWYRRYVKTTVLAHWSTFKPAYRVAFEDFSELIASGDHRFLSGRGWKHVANNPVGTKDRAHLTTNDRLLGTGGFAKPPLDSRDYRRGYVCGMVRGDAHLASHAYRRASGATSTRHVFRLALTDLEALRRTRIYLEEVGVETSERLFQAATATARSLRSIQTGRRAGVEHVRELVAWPRRASRDWLKGFLAGIFDAEGSYGGTVVQIHNKDDEIVAWITWALRRLGFNYVEDRPRPNGCMSVRLVGGLREVLRFFHTVDPAISRKRDIGGMALKCASRLRVASIEPLGIEMPMYDITTGTGDFIANGVVSHNCFARPTHRYLDFDAGRDFEREIVVKVNVPELLRA
jgi:intein/homing endonuclease